MAKGDKPHFTLWAANDHGKGRCGAAWRNDDGSISIQLDPWTILRGKGHAGGAQTLMLFPPEATAQRNPTPDNKPKAETRIKGKFDDLEDDIPF